VTHWPGTRTARRALAAAHDTGPVAGRLGVSIYLTVAHYTTSVSLICSDKGLVNCEKVTTSAQSMIFGIFPVAVLGWRFTCSWSPSTPRGDGGPGGRPSRGCASAQ